MYPPSSAAMARMSTFVLKNPPWVNQQGHLELKTGESIDAAMREGTRAELHGRGHCSRRASTSAHERLTKNEDVQDRARKTLMRLGCSRRLVPAAWRC